MDYVALLYPPGEAPAPPEPEPLVIRGDVSPETIARLRRALAEASRIPQHILFGMERP